MRDSKYAGALWYSNVGGPPTDEYGKLKAEESWEKIRLNIYMDRAPLRLTWAKAVDGLFISSQVESSGCLILLNIFSVKTIVVLLIIKNFHLL